MSIQFKPTNTLSNGEQHYDSVVSSMLVYLKEGQKVAASVCEGELKRLDKEWAKEGEQ